LLRTGMPGVFAPCPPAFGLLLYLRKTPGHPSPRCCGFAGSVQNHLRSLGRGVSAAAKSRRRPQAGGHERR